MSYADDVRKYCLESIVIPARNRGETEISIRAGDIHKALKYADRLPLVCSALGASKFEKMANLEKISISGPSNGANAIFKFAISDHT